MKLEDKILRYVINELDSRAIVDKESYINCFGCKSWDEIAEGIKKRFLNKVTE